MGSSERIRPMRPALIVASVSVSDISEQAMHPAAPLTTERSIQKCRPIKLLWTGRGTGLRRPRSAAAPSASKYRPIPWIAYYKADRRIVLIPSRQVTSIGRVFRRISHLITKEIIMGMDISFRNRDFRCSACFWGKSCAGGCVWLDACEN
jgi:hypothetical protein